MTAYNDPVAYNAAIPYNGSAGTCTIGTGFIGSGTIGCSAVVFFRPLRVGSSGFPTEMGGADLIEPTLLGTGTYSVDVVLRGNQTWGAVPAAGTTQQVQYNDTGMLAGANLLIIDANTVALRNSTSAQRLWVFDSYNNAHYQRLALNTGLAGDWLQIAAEAFGTGSLNHGLAVTPAGTGPLSAHVPDSTAAGGNARGDKAVDWQLGRESALQVASGDNSVIAGGNSNRASGLESVVGGGYGNIASADGAVVSGGYNNEASGVSSCIPGGIEATTRGINGAFAFSAGAFSSVLGSAQKIELTTRTITSSTDPATLTSDAQPVAADNCMVLPLESSLAFECLVTAVHAAGAATGGWEVRGSARRGASGDAVVVYWVATHQGLDAAIGVPTIEVVANAGGAGAGGIVLYVTPANATPTRWVSHMSAVQAVY